MKYSSPSVARHAQAGHFLMPQDMRLWRKLARSRLIIELGSECADCGTSEKPLTFDHITPLTPEQAEHRERIGINSRLVLYRKEAAQGLLQLLCQKCQNKKSGTLFAEGNTAAAKGQNENEPF